MFTTHPAFTIYHTQVDDRIHPAANPARRQEHGFFGGGTVVHTRQRVLSWELVAPLGSRAPRLPPLQCHPVHCLPAPPCGNY